MSVSRSKTKTRVKGAIPQFAEVEITREWDDDDDNVINYGDRIAIRVCDGAYWQVNIENQYKVMATAHQVKEWEVIEIVAVGDEFVSQKYRPVKYGDKVAFRFVTNDRFVGANTRIPSGELTANVPWVKPWEIFTLVEFPERPMPKDKKARFGSWFSLRADNKKYVMFELISSKQLMACASEIKEWEGFVFFRPPKDLLA